MGTVFWLFGYISGYVAILALAMCIASALYLLSEFAEEFPSATSKIIKYLLVGSSVLQIVLWMDGLPLYESILQCLAFGAYSSMLQTFPFVRLLSWRTVSSILLFLSTNLLWLRYFLKNHKEPLPIVGFFLVVVWSVPCGLFVSISVSENQLPGALSVTSENNNHNGIDSKGSNVFRKLYDFLATHISEFLGSMGLSSPTRLVQDKRR
jgi:hypothetical protein